MKPTAEEEFKFDLHCKRCKNIKSAYVKDSELMIDCKVCGEVKLIRIGDACVFNPKESNNSPLPFFDEHCEKGKLIVKKMFEKFDKNQNI